mgnify:FL=1
MKKETFNMIIRFLVGAAVSMLICAGMIVSGKWVSSKPLIQQASGLKGTEIVMTVDGEEISAEEYLYMANYSAQSLSYYGITDLNTQLGEDYTAADYVAEQAQSQVVQQAVIRKWAKDVNVALTEDDQTILANKKESYGEGGFEKLLKLNGVSEELFDQITGSSMLYEKLYNAYCGENGEMRPSDSDLSALAQEHGLMTADVLYVSTEGMDDAAKAETRTMMEDYVRQLNGAADKEEAFAALERGENVSAYTGATYDGCEETPLNTALAALEVGQVSGVIEDDAGLFVALRCQTDLSAAAELAFGEDLSLRMENAEVAYNEAVYNKIDLAAYYTKFSAARQQVYNQLMQE